MAFTDPFVRNIKTTARIENFREKTGDGFGVRAYATGTKVFFFEYHFDGKPRYLNLGKYPACSLAEARKKHREAQGKLDKGIDPLAEKELAEDERRRTPTVAELAAEYMEKHAKPKKKDWRKDELCLNNDVLPAWGKRKASDIKKRDVILLLESIVERGAPTQSNSVLEVTRKMFNFAVERDILEYTPFIGVKPLGAKVVRNRYLSEGEIRTVWATIATAGMTEEIRRALKLILVTAQRPGEVLGMHRREVNGRWWTIPAERAKNGREHLVYLTDKALELIGGKEGYIFESPRPLILEDGKTTVPKPMDGNALASAVRNNCPTDCTFDSTSCQNEECKKAEGKCEETNRLGVPFFRPHDLRRTANTHMARLRVPLEHREAILNHSRGTLDGTYNLHDYQDEKKRAMEKWGRELERIISGNALGKVIPISRTS
jgi:integrase